MTFSPTETTQFVDVVVNDDTFLEESENFIALLSLPPASSGVILGDMRATATIEDNDSE